MSTRRLIMIAAAAVVVFGGCGDPGAPTSSAATPTPEPEATGTDAANAAATETAPSPSPTAAPSPTTSPTTAPRPSDGPESAVQEWLQALAAADLDTVYKQLTPASQDAVGGRDGLETLRTELAEGLAAYGRIDADSVATQVSEDLWVVVVSGEVEREGMREFDAFAVPTVPTDAGGWRIAAFQHAADVTFDPPRGLVRPDQEFTASVDDGDHDLTLIVDGEAVDAASGADAVSYTPDPPLEPGDHALTVVVQGPGDTVQAGAEAYLVSNNP